MRPVAVASTTARLLLVTLNRQICRLNKHVTSSDRSSRFGLSVLEEQQLYRSASLHITMCRSGMCIYQYHSWADSLVLVCSDEENFSAQVRLR